MEDKPTESRSEYIIRKIKEQDGIRKFPFITLGRIEKFLREDGTPVSRLTLNKLEKEGLFTSERTVGRWRRYSEATAALVVKLIQENYGFYKK